MEERTVGRLGDPRDERACRALPGRLRDWLRRNRLAPRLRLRELFLIVAEHDDATAAHCVRVCQYALWLAHELGLGREARTQLGLAAWLHDAGKLFIPPAVLNRPGGLTPEEARRMQFHPVLGESLLRPFLLPSPVLEAVRWHHERPDGRGYPDGLKGDEIPLLGRALAVADCFDAMTSERTYRPPLSTRAALEELRRGAGSHFDRVVVERFAEALRRAEKVPGREVS